MKRKIGKRFGVLAALLLLAGCAAQRAGKVAAEMPGAAVTPERAVTSERAGAAAEKALDEGVFVIELTEIFSPEWERSDLHDSALTMSSGRFEMRLDAVLFRQQPFSRLDYLNLTDDKAVLKREKSGTDGSRRYLLEAAEGLDWNQSYRFHLTLFPGSDRCLIRVEDKARTVREVCKLRGVVKPI